jgi:uncharacterized protein (TIGR00251 family)
VSPAGDSGLDFRPEPGRRAVRLRLRVSAGAAKSRVVGPHGGALKLSVRTAPEKGKANREVLALVAETFGIPPSGVEMISGETSPDKVVRLPLTPAEAAARWDRAAPAAPRVTGRTDPG